MTDITSASDIDIEQDVTDVSQFSLEIDDPSEEERASVQINVVVGGADVFREKEERKQNILEIFLNLLGEHLVVYNLTFSFDSFLIAWGKISDFKLIRKAAVSYRCIDGLSSMRPQCLCYLL